MTGVLLQTPLYSGVVSFIVAIIIGPYTIKYLHRLKFGQNVRSDGPKRHLQKSGTPTMGGVIILVGLSIAILLFHRSFGHLLFALFATLAFGVIGFLDDLLMILTRSSLGLKARHKLLGQILVAILVALYAMAQEDIGTGVLIPFSDYVLQLPTVIYILLVIGVMLGSANAVNLTDGLDGLAAGTMAVASGIYAIVAARLDNPAMALFAGAVAGACLGFAWFNAHPAAIFMGDTGSLGLGAAFGVMGIFTKTPLFLPIIGGLFVIETLSVIIQVVYFRITKGKRVFKMAPLHHHFELSGWEEPKVMIRFWLISLLFGVIGLLAIL